MSEGGKDPRSIHRGHKPKAKSPTRTQRWWVQLRCSLRLLLRPPPKTPASHNCPASPVHGDCLCRNGEGIIGPELSEQSALSVLLMSYTVKQPRGCALHNFKAKEIEQSLLSTLRPSAIWRGGHCAFLVWLRHEVTLVWNAAWLLCPSLRNPGPRSSKSGGQTLHQLHCPF